MSIAKQSKAVYEADHRERLEIERFGEYAAIEPISRDIYVANTFIEAAKTAHPDRSSFVVRIGHEAAVHLGFASRLGRLELLH